MSQVPKLCNDMMNLGRLQGFEVSFVGLHNDMCCTHYDMCGVL